MNQATNSTYNITILAIVVFLLCCSYQVSQLEEVTDLQDALDARGVNHFDYLADSASY